MKKDILDIIDHRSGETVPEGYFDSFRSRMKMELPERRWEYDDGRGSASESDNRSWWQRVRPYVYMAAMFIGVWLMMNMFTLFQPARSGDINDSPTLLAALSNDTFVDDYVTSEVDNYDLLDDLYDTGFDPASIMAFDTEIPE